MASSERAIVLLRGINIGGHHAVPMATLRTLFADAVGCSSISTYIQSGNLVCTPPLSGLTASAVSNAIEQRFGFPVPVAVRTEAEWNALIAANPFLLNSTGADLLHAAFFESPPSDKTMQQLEGKRAGEEQLAACGRELYLSLPHGVGRSKLALAVCAAAVPGNPTMRNWRTVVKLQAML